MFHRIRTDEQGRKQEPANQPSTETNTESSELLDAVLEDAPEEVQESIRSEVDAQQDDSQEDDTQEEATTQIETPNETEEEEAETMTAQPQEQNFEIEDDAAMENENTQTRAMPNNGGYHAQPAPVSRAPGSYPGSYAAAPSYGTKAPQQEPEQAIGDRKLTIGPGINMSGEIESCDHLIVEGTVEAALRGASFLEIEETGTYYGSVEISEAIIAGRFEGDLSVDGRVTIRSTGVVTGTISYKELEVESGAVIDGRITPLKATAKESGETDSARAKERAAAIAKAKEIKAKQSGQQQAQPANTDGGLFEGRAKAAE